MLTAMKGVLTSDSSKKDLQPDLFTAWPHQDFDFLW